MIKRIAISGRRRAKEKLMVKQHRNSVFALGLSMVLGLSNLAFTSNRNRANAQQSFSLRALDGRMVTADDLRGQVVVLAFGAAWLPISKKQAEGVRKLANEYAKRGVIVYFVATDSDSPGSKNYASDSQLEAFSKRNGLNVTILRDPNGQFSKQLGVDQIPAFVILDKQGNVLGSPIGGMDENGDVIGQLAPEIDKAL